MRTRLAALVAAFFLVLAPRSSAQGTAIGFEEEFALSTDRAGTLARLIPGTEEHSFYSCLLAQNEGRLDDVGPLLRDWIERHGRTQRVLEIEARQALLDWKRDPAAASRLVSSRLGLSFSDQRQIRGVDPDLPVKLDPALLDLEQFTRRALTGHSGTVAGFTDSGLRALATRPLDESQLVSLLQRLTVPDLPNLVDLVVRELRRPRSPGFGALPIHAKLTLDQLDQLVAQMPGQINSPAFVDDYLNRLAPEAGVDLERDAAARDAYIARLESFVARLSAVHNSLKAHVLHHRLAFDLTRDKVDVDKLMAYLRLPRQANWVNPEYVQRNARQNDWVVPNSRFATTFAAIDDGATLVKDCLEHLFAAAGSFEQFGDYIEERWLRRVFAETKILAGVGDMQQWYALIDDPAYYERLRDRVEIAFPATARKEFALDEAVELAVDVKNVKTLIVKVFEIDTFNYLRAMNREVDASIDLDGLVATEERTETFADEPLRRVRRGFSFPTIDHPGVWIVELIGNGIASRAVIRKGALRCIDRPGAAGQILRVLSEDGSTVGDARVWFGDREYAADAEGEIVIPYSTAPGTKRLILRRGTFATLGSLQHLAEEYSLDLGVFVERESLLPGQNAKLLLRPSLFLCGRRIPLDVLTETVLTITSVDADGIVSSSDVRDLTWSANAETVHEIRVPERLTHLSVALRAKVHSVSTGKDVGLGSTPREFDLNGIDATAATSCPLLGRNADGFVLDVLGKDGEPKASRALHVQLHHRDFVDPLEVTLKTDARGRIELGPLEGIAKLVVDGFPGGSGHVDLDDRARTLPASLQGEVGSTLRFPWPERSRGLQRGDATLFETRGPRSDFARDRSDRLALVDGFLELRGLEAGSYTLILGGSRFVAVNVVAGRRTEDWIVGRDRALQIEDGQRLQILDVAVDGKDLRIALAYPRASTRVHLSVTRYLAANDPFRALVAPGRAAADSIRTDFLASSYHIGREIGDEYRYILERRFTTKFPGNMLSRPGLLLNPWALEEWNTAIGLGGGAGGRFGGRSGGRGGRSAGGDDSSAGNDNDVGGVADLAFLPRSPAVLTNLRPGGDGVVRVPLADLGDGQLVHVLAIDVDDTVYRAVPLPEKRLIARPQHLARALDPTRDFAQTRKIEFVDAGGKVVVADARSADIETFDSLAAVHRLFRTLSGSSDLDAFAFVIEWPKLTPQEKRKQFSEHVCHELDFFVFMKDRPFFEEVVKPYLANKSQKTFVDEWLLGSDLTRYLDPYAFGRLNVVEQILLAQRFGGERDGIERLIVDRADLQAPDPANVQILFDRLIGSSALAMDARIGVALQALKNVDPESIAEKGKDAGRPTAGADRQRRAAVGAAPNGPSTAGPGRPAQAPAEEAAPVDELAESKESQFGVLADADKKAEDQAKRELERRRDARELYHAPDVTRRLAESHYWHVPLGEMEASLIDANEFWRDYARAVGRGGKFVSPHVAQAIGNFAEMMFALAVLDLPFTATEPDTAIDGTSLTLTAKSPLLAVRREIALAAGSTRDGSPILVSQNFFRLDDRYRFEGNERRDAWVTDEFVVDVVYGCQVVITNPTSSPRRLDVLLQIPAGSLPVQGARATRGMSVELQPYGTQALEYHFYFPAPLDAVHYPVHVSADGVAIAAAQATVLHVVTDPTKVDTTSWEHLSQDGSPEAVIAYIDNANLLRIDLSRIAWRMRDRAFFVSTLSHLRRRHVYADRLWSYAALHRDEVALAEYLRHQDSFLGGCGRYLVSPLLTVDPVERRSYEHLEFDPLFNARAHRFGRERRILNSKVAEQYLALLSILCYRPALDDADWASVTYYLLLQDRVDEALTTFARIDPTRIPARIQYDYMRAYVDFFRMDTADARGIAERYRDHPVERWRKLFREVLTQIDEIDGSVVGLGDEDERTRRQTGLAETEPSLEFTLEGNRGLVRHRNLERCEVRYFAMDVEFLFSTHPFVQQGSDAFSFVRPNRTDVLPLGKDRGETGFDLPAEFASANVLVEITAAGITRREVHFAHSLDVRWMEGYGQLQVTETATGKPLPKVYVKVFSSDGNNGVSFHKDGYTDLRGRFDYASVSGVEGRPIAKFAVLVLSEDHGAVIRELQPPTR